MAILIISAEDPWIGALIAFRSAKPRTIALAELIFDAKIDELEIIKPVVHDLMVSAMPMKVPVLVEVNTGDNWLAAH